METNSHHGKQLKTLGLKQIEVYLYTCAFTSQRVYPHNHLFYEVNICLDGTFINNINKTEIPFSKRSCAILRPSDIHFFDTESDKSKLYRHQDIYITKEKMKECCDFLSPDLFERINSDKNPISFTLSNKDYEFVTDALNVFEKKFNYDTEFLEAVHKTVIVQVLTAYMKSVTLSNKASFPVWMTSLINKMNDPAYLTKTEPEVAAEFGYTTSHFSREFKKYMKMTYIQYLNIRKVNYAADLILNSDKQIIEISQILGYSSPSPFNIHFKEVFNCSPSQYKRTFRHD